MERDGIQEVDDLDVVTVGVEPPAELGGRAVVTRAHGRRHNENPPTHGGRHYFLRARGACSFRPATVGRITRTGRRV